MSFMVSAGRVCFSMASFRMLTHVSRSMSLQLEITSPATMSRMSAAISLPMLTNPLTMDSLLMAGPPKKAANLLGTVRILTIPMWILSL